MPLRRRFSFPGPTRGQSRHLTHSSCYRARDRCGPSFRVHDQFRPSESSYDSQQLKKLDAKRPLDNRSPPRGSALSSSMRSLQDNPGGPWSLSERHHYQLPQLSVPTGPKPNQLLDSPRYPDTPLTSAASPRTTSFSQLSRHHDYRSPTEPVSGIEFDRSPFSRTRRQNSGPLLEDLTPESYDNDPDLEETNRLRHIHLDEGHHSRMNSLSYEAQLPSLKRRASSPPVEEPAIRHASSQSDLLRRREGVSRNSPAPRLSVNPPHGSISSVSSGDRSGSFGGLSTATSMTSSHSFDRRSPVGYSLSPGGLSPTEMTTSPFATPNPMTLSPRTTMIPRAGPHQRGPSDARNVASPRKLTEPTLRISTGTGKSQGFFMCDCCPKKPKKFDTREELT